jgi:hypothetical protein
MSVFIMPAAEQGRPMLQVCKYAGGVIDLQKMRLCDAEMQ